MIIQEIKEKEKIAGRDLSFESENLNLFSDSAGFLILRP